MNKKIGFIFLVYLTIFLTLDYLNMPLKNMMENQGTFITLLHKLMSLLLASLSTYLFYLHEDIYKHLQKEVAGSNTPIYAALFGVLTYGCTPCVVSFFASLGIHITVIALPWAGLPYKVISLLILFIGIFITKKQQAKACPL